MNAQRSEMSTRFRTEYGPIVFDMSEGKLDDPKDQAVFRERIGWTASNDGGEGSNGELGDCAPAMQNGSYEVFDVEILHNTTEWCGVHDRDTIFRSKYIKRVSFCVPKSASKQDQ
jgi:hypothetical protein